jgi:hypothetical protein
MGTSLLKLPVNLTAKLTTNSLIKSTVDLSTRESNRLATWYYIRLTSGKWRHYYVHVSKNGGIPGRYDGTEPMPAFLVCIPSVRHCGWLWYVYFRKLLERMTITVHYTTWVMAYDELPAWPARVGYTKEQYKEAREKILNKKVAYGILVCADRSRYGKLIEEIENDFLMGNNNYPKMPTEAYNLLMNYKNYGNMTRETQGISFKWHSLWRGRK